MSVTPRRPLAVQPHPYIGDVVGRPLDRGMIYFGEPDKDPQDYPITVYLDPEQTKPAHQPIRTKGGFINVFGDITEIFADEILYSLKVLDCYGRLVFYKKRMHRDNITEELGGEIVRAQKAESALQSSIDAEATRAKAAESDLNTGLAKEVSDRKLEVTRLDEADAVLQAQINSVGGGKLAYKTYAEMIADKSNIATKSSIDIIADTDDKNGTYLYDGTNFVKSKYDLEKLIRAKVQNTFGTYARMVDSNLSDGAYALVADDADDKNGIYIKESGSWKKTKFDFKGIAQDVALMTADKFASKYNILLDTKDTLIKSSKAIILDNKVKSDVGTSWKTTPSYVVQPISYFIVYKSTVDTTNQLDKNSAWDSSKASLNASVVFMSKTEDRFLGFNYHPTTKQLRFLNLGLDNTSVVKAINTGVQSVLKSWQLKIIDLPALNAMRCYLYDYDGGQELASMDISYSDIADVDNYDLVVGVYSGHLDCEFKDLIISTDSFDFLSTEGEANGIELVGNTSIVTDANKVYDIDIKEPDGFLIDDFKNKTGRDSIVNSKPIWSRYQSTYASYGEPQWVFTKDGVSISSIGQGAYSGRYDDAMLMYDVKKRDIQDMRGVEISTDIKVPSNNFRAGVAVGYDAGFDADSGAGYLFAQLEIRNNVGRITIHSIPISTDDTDSPTKVYKEDLDDTFELPEDGWINVTLECYSSKDRGDLHDLVIAKVAGVRCAKFYFVPSDLSYDRTPLQNITSVGIAQHSTLPNAPQVVFKNLIVKALEQRGSSAYRSLPPEPAPVVPNFSEPQVVFDVAAEADPLAMVSPNAGILGPSILPMLDYADKLGITPIDNYYMYYSTNHGKGESGIWLATAPSPEGPWTRYNGNAGDNRIYVDTVSGSQTEQPQVAYDDVGNRLIMMYHNKNAISTVQVSIIALSQDGINFTRQGFASDAQPQLRGTYIRHDGYSSMCSKDPLGVVSGWIGWFRLHGGAGRTNYSSLWSVARSNDGVTWTSDLLPIRIPSFQQPQHHQDRLDNVGYGAAPFAYRGQRLFPIAPFISKAVGSSKGYLAIVRLGDDMRNMSAEEYVIEKTLPTEDGVTSISSVFVRDNTLYLYYTADCLYVHLITADLSAPPKGVNRII